MTYLPLHAILFGTALLFSHAASAEALVELGVVYPSNACGQECGSTALCVRCENGLAATGTTASDFFMCIPKTAPQQCHVGAIRPAGKDMAAPIQAFGGRAADSNVERVGKLIAETPEKLRQIREQQEARDKLWKDFDRAKPKP